MSSYLQKYAAITKPEALTIPITRYVIVDKDVLAESQEAFDAAVALDILSNAICKRMTEHFGIQYQVFPLEGVWHLIDRKIGFSAPENIEGRMMIKQPLELTEQLFEEIRIEVLQNNEEANLAGCIKSARLQSNDAEKVIQMLHIGSYTHEPATFAIMNEFARRHGFDEKGEYHREIYLKDVRHAIPDKYETILRQPQ
ncbi:MAG: hypothetical protein ACFCVD_12055 [Nodosilinea sp.]